jgi:4a-hydroxytetrahydrobiopterin dehydratase
VPTITPQDIQRLMKDVPGWTLVDGRAIRKQFTFGSFPEAISFVVRIAFQAEAADHHPDITINWKHVALSYTTHSEGGLTEKDFAGAQKADRISWVG